MFVQDNHSKFEARRFKGSAFSKGGRCITTMFLYMYYKVKYNMCGMEVISFRIPKELKKSIKEVDINWSEEVRRFIEDKVREYKRGKALEKIDSMLKNVPPSEKGTASRYVREDRDRN